MADLSRYSVLLVDDEEEVLGTLAETLRREGYGLRTAASPDAALRLLADGPVAVVVSDHRMPGMTGTKLLAEVRRLAPDTMRLILTAHADLPTVLEAINQGEVYRLITKPWEDAELKLTIREALAHYALAEENRRLQALTEAQNAQLRALNATLEERVRRQVEQLERVGRLRRYLARPIVDLILSSGDETFLQSHRQEIAMLFCDLRRFTAFSESAEPEEVLTVLREYHGAVGPLIARFEGTLEHFAGDGLGVLFNDPLPCRDPAARAVRMALAMREGVGELRGAWRRRGHQLDFGVGIAMGYATLGEIGFEGRFQYAAIGSVPNLASRLCDEAQGGQVLVTQRVYSEVERLVEAEPLGEIALKGFHHPIPAYNVIRLRGGNIAE
jgi:class 3 adenylate cyclase